VIDYTSCALESGQMTNLLEDASDKMLYFTVAYLHWLCFRTIWHQTFLKANKVNSQMQSIGSSKHFISLPDLRTYVRTMLDYEYYL